MVHQNWKSGQLDPPGIGDCSSVVQPPSQKRRPLSDLEVCQKILLSKGRVVPPRSIVQAINGRMKTFHILDIMWKLAQKGAGSMQCESGGKKFSFVKRRAEEIIDVLEDYSVNVDLYSKRYYADIQTMNLDGI